jgi:hypothetical protein
VTALPDQCQYTRLVVAIVEKHALASPPKLSFVKALIPSFCVYKVAVFKMMEIDSSCFRSSLITISMYNGRFTQGTFPRDKLQAAGMKK